VTEVSAFKYRIFLSCSDAAKAWGNWLRAALEGYRIDKNLVGLKTPTGLVSRSLRPIFCNREHVSSASPLPSDRTLAALHASQFLVVLCSPSAAKSACINEEIRRFKEIGRADRVILVIVGDPGDPWSANLFRGNYASGLGRTDD
jgi:eukaryotic-like serine/threonine-protein kinase